MGRLRALWFEQLVEKVDAAGESFQRSSGFVLQSGEVVTAFEAVDGATSVRILYPDSHVARLQEVAAFSRAQDWAVMSPGHAVSGCPEVQPPKAWNVGDRVFSLAVSGDGARSIVDTSISGTRDVPESGQRLVLQTAMSDANVGSPVLDEFGRIVGLVVASGVPGDWSVDYAVTLQTASGRSSPAVAAPFAVPMSVIPRPAAVRPAALAELWQTGQMTPPLGRDRRHIMRGTLAQSSQKQPGWFVPVDEKSTFSQRDGTFEVVLNLDPKARVSTTVRVRMFGTDGRPAGEGRPSKLSLRPGEGRGMTWKVDPSTVSPGLYRIEVVFGTEPVWRSFVRVVR